ncbi:MAG: prephenate dehydrogenase/arogenate dehydrogenase family protein [Prosthecobacter sp.]|uniref:prephenate dehydrogenase n=1 Tax=Prosthecobacter sp. TaxID=1965333 RepID=UPI0019E5EEBB|nr:prephenate dehydrogenase/arogenate dehydrogenase family protein [Prosthecobacter sp.]MBE2282481.1 prephenate dehydrogenase/arogenate dehydrogenase family protein [Prosthecobacter sp.]
MSVERSIAIFSPGLLGGSLIKTILQRLPGVEIRVWARREEAAEEVRREMPAVFASTSVPEVVRGTSLAILCMPIQHMPDIARQMAAAEMADDLLVTDVGSVKGSVVADLEPIFAPTKAVFIGSHPMAGSQRTGLANATGDLFHHAACLLTPTGGSRREDVDRLRAFWVKLGCRVREMTPQQHDRCVARISHLPHAMAVLTTLAALHDDTSVLDSAAGGFRDTTRVAGGDPAMWAGIFLNNRSEVMSALEDASGVLRDLLEMLKTMDEEALRQFLVRAKSLRDLLPAG